jgi:hypothetical protein
VPTGTSQLVCSRRNQFKADGRTEWLHARLYVARVGVLASMSILFPTEFPTAAHAQERPTSQVQLPDAPVQQNTGALPIQITRWTSPWNFSSLSQPDPAAVAQKLRAARRIAPDVRNLSMSGRLLATALASQLKPWSVSVVEAGEPCDAEVVVDHHFSTFVWQFEIVEYRSRTVIDTGSVVALTEKRAAVRISTAVAHRFAGDTVVTNRLAISSQRTGLSLTSTLADRPEKWKVKDLSADGEPRATLLIKDGSLVGLGSDENVLFSIPTDRILDVAEELTGFHSLQEVADLDPWDFGPNLMTAPLVLIADMTPVSRSHHVINIAWNDNNEVKMISLQVSAASHQRIFELIDSFTNASF